MEILKCDPLEPRKKKRLLLFFWYCSVLKIECVRKAKYIKWRLHSSCQKDAFLQLWQLRRAPGVTRAEENHAPRSTIGSWHLSQRIPPCLRELKGLSTMASFGNSLRICQARKRREIIRWGKWKRWSVRSLIGSAGRRSWWLGRRSAARDPRKWPLNMESELKISWLERNRGR